MNTRPLTNVTVIDLADEALALASRLLAELGARVIRIESKDGDSIRDSGPLRGSRTRR